MAAMLDFEVLICDPREEYAATLDLAALGACRVAGMPDDVVRELRRPTPTPPSWR